jgi:hypothetical protein
MKHENVGWICGREKLAFGRQNVRGGKMESLGMTQRSTNDKLAKNSEHKQGTPPERGTH